MSKIDEDTTRKVLTALAEEFLVDIPAVHTDKGVYYIEYNQLAGSLILADGEWYRSIAEYANGVE
jgi:hypothetical protein